jgi:ABC-type nitrate/sulfonate/bicarbonate transport system substrate-binding protein
MLKVFLSVLLAVTSSFICFDPVTAQDRARVGWAAMTASHTPLWVAQEKGFLAKQGLLVESIFFSAGPPAMQALVAGDLDIVVTSAPNVVNPRLGGADTVMILSIIPTFIDHIISASNITNPEQLRGKIGSVNRFGSISEMGLRLSLKRLGIDPEKDVRIVPAGGNPERLAAISKGISQFTIMNEPFIKEAERLGFRDLVNMATLKIPLHGNGIVTREAIIKTKRAPLLPSSRAPSPKRSTISRLRRTPRKRSSASTPGLPIPRASNVPIRTTLRYCWMCLMPIPPV